MSSPQPAPILPGATIGVFGSGQLGRMMALAARAMGYRVATFSPETDSPTGQVADHEIAAPYDDEEALRRFMGLVDVITFEFENVPAHVATLATEVGLPVRPGGHVLHTAQQRARENSFFADAGLPVAPFALVETLAELEAALTIIGTPAILKTAAFGYDGKGQAAIDTPADASQAWESIGKQAAILEAFVDFSHELSIVAARGADGAFVHYGAIENQHRNHILDLSIAPARLVDEITQEAAMLAQTVMNVMDVVGVLCVEFFLTHDNQLLINEMAPRPHNSGHLTVDAAITSQFEQQVRAVCGLPLGSPELTRPAAMVNLLGDLWQDGTPDWASVCGWPNVKLHLYGKEEARPGRKMGHLTVLDNDIEQAIATAVAARKALTTRQPV